MKKIDNLNIFSENNEKILMIFDEKSLMGDP